MCLLWAGRRGIIWNSKLERVTKGESEDAGFWDGRWLLRRIYAGHLSPVLLLKLRRKAFASRR
jgi:hypothetical protein